VDFTLPLAIFAFRGIIKHRKCFAQSGSGGFRNTAHVDSFREAVAACGPPEAPRTLAKAARHARNYVLLPLRLMRSEKP